MWLKRCINLLLLICLPVIGSAQGECNVKNCVFKPGEKIDYRIYYHWHFVWIEAGEVNFNVTLKDYYNRHCYYFTGNGRTYPKYEWFYKVRDTVQTYLDTTRFQSMRFERVSHEGNTNVCNDNVFDNADHKVYCLSKDNHGRYHQDSCTIPPLTYDILAGMYYARCLDFSKCRYNDTIPLKLYLDNKVYSVHLKYRGKENISTSFGTFRCIKLTVDLISGTLFKEGAQLTAWVTDDDNRIPVFMEAPIIVGEVRAELLSFSNLRNPMDAKVK